jgi:hypothetical protein
VAAEFLNLGAKLRGGLPYQPWAAALVKERRAQLGKDDPVGDCKPGGAVRILTYPPYRKFLHLPDLFVILSERDVTYRQIFTDERPLPTDPDPTFNGYSTGRWDGDTLVVETNGLREGTWLDRIGSPISDVAKMTERFRRVNYGRLEIDLTITAPTTSATRNTWSASSASFLLVAFLLDRLDLLHAANVVYLLANRVDLG